MIIPVYNEEKIIKRKIKNSLLLDYPKEKLEIIVASDGSTDDTKAIVEKYLTQGVNFFEFPRRGKLATLNRVFPKTKGDILVLTDASAMFNNDALRMLVKHFVNDDIGVVTGVEKICTKENYISKSEQSYWNYESKIKELESKIYSTVGANGPIYAIRRDLFPSIPSHLNLCDDMTISLNAVQKGKRIILEPQAIALEDVSLTLREEWRRKMRISTRAWQALLYHKNLLNPFRSHVAFPLIFHKVLRWLTLPLMLVIFISNLFIGGGIYIVFLIFQIIFHSLSSFGIILLLKNIKIPSIVTFLSYFLFTNLAQIVGFYNSIFNKGQPIWQPIERGGE
ncbi:unnamed protein product [marine sediment metagenome]|uniref:Glycosyltransferase 2-like domain-containing protein n=1 Tax=marine sediment metagenome TaxID=412755 RepID=X1R6E8_9ZZZZ